MSLQMLVKRICWSHGKGVVEDCVLKLSVCGTEVMFSWQLCKLEGTPWFLLRFYKCADQACVCFCVDRDAWCFCGSGTTLEDMGWKNIPSSSLTAGCTICPKMGTFREFWVTWWLPLGFVGSLQFWDVSLIWFKFTARTFFILILT